MRRLELSLRRYYIVYAMQVGRPDRVADFFAVLGAELQDSEEWRDWFGSLLLLLLPLLLLLLLLLLRLPPPLLDGVLTY